MTFGTTTRRAALSASLILLCGALAASPSWTQEARWWKGNLHTHTLWSDGDDYPEMVLDWYKSNGYHFVAISDHNILSAGSKWVHPDQALDDQPRRTYARYVERFGDDWVDDEVSLGQLAVRLRTFEEYRRLLDEEGRFLTFQAEEITDSFGRAALHVNATNLVEFIPPQGGDSVVDVLTRNIDAVHAQRERTGRPMFAHLNHPNFRWSISLDDFVAVENESFFEVYNGHPGVHNDGGPEGVGMDELWDHALTRRLTSGGRVLWGLAVDDAHNYGEMRLGAMNAGRGWVMVRSSELSESALIAALEAGDFYSTTGVELEQVEASAGRLDISIRAEPGVVYTTEFLGTRRGDDGTGKIGEVLAVDSGARAVYELEGDEIYVRARITSSKPKVNGYRAGEMERAWIQPVVGGKD